MIPRLRSDGTLPPGVHQTTLAELFAIYPSTNQQRQILNDSLRRVVTELRALDSSMLIYVDGSFVTNKREPNDVDILIITSQYDTLALLKYLELTCPVEMVSIGLYVEPSSHNVMLDFFTTTRLGQAKGIILLT